MHVRNNDMGFITATWHSEAILENCSLLPLISTSNVLAMRELIEQQIWQGIMLVVMVLE